MNPTDSFRWIPNQAHSTENYIPPPPPRVRSAAGWCGEAQERGGKWNEPLHDTTRWCLFTSSSNVEPHLQQHRVQKMWGNSLFPPAFSNRLSFLLFFCLHYIIFFFLLCFVPCCYVLFFHILFFFLGYPSYVFFYSCPLIPCPHHGFLDLFDPFSNFCTSSI